MHCRNTTVLGSLRSEGRRILPPVGPEARRQAFELQPVDDVRDRAVAVFAVAAQRLGFLLLADGVELIAGRHDDGADVFGNERVLLIEVDGLAAAYFRALAADNLLDAFRPPAKEGAVGPINDRDVRDRLWKRDVDGSAHAEALVEFAWESSCWGSSSGIRHSRCTWSRPRSGPSCGF